MRVVCCGIAFLFAYLAFNAVAHPAGTWSSPPDTATTTVTPGGRATITKQEGAP